MTLTQRQRKIAKLRRLQLEVSTEARCVDLSSADRMNLARAADALRTAIEAMAS